MTTPRITPPTRATRKPVTITLATTASNGTPTSTPTSTPNPTTPSTTTPGARSFPIDYRHLDPAERAIAVALSMVKNATAADRIAPSRALDHTEQLTQAARRAATMPRSYATDIALTLISQPLNPKAPPVIYRYAARPTTGVSTRGLLAALIAAITNITTTDTTSTPPPAPTDTDTSDPTTPPPKTPTKHHTKTRGARREPAPYDTAPETLTRPLAATLATITQAAHQTTATEHATITARAATIAAVLHNPPPELATALYAAATRRTPEITDTPTLARLVVAYTTLAVLPATETRRRAAHAALRRAAAPIVTAELAATPTEQTLATITRLLDALPPTP